MLFIMTFFAFSICQAETNNEPLHAVALQDNLLVEVYQKSSSTELWYRVGSVDKDKIEWGQSSSYEKRAHSPALGMVANTVIGIHNNINHDLFYKIGTLDPVSKAIQWGPSYRYDSGFTPSITTNGNIVIAIHQAQYAVKLYYRMGILDALEKKIIWLDDKK